MKRLVFTVTNDLNYDQRMIRICSSLSDAGYQVLLIGRNRNSPLIKKKYAQKRLSCFFKKGKLFYAEYNSRLFFTLLFLKFDLVCAIDLDTIVPCYLVSALRKKKRVYDAHELFSEMKEVVSRPNIYRLWKTIERKFVPKYTYGYTVNNYISSILNEKYQVDYQIVRNIPILRNGINKTIPENFVLYQGAVNHGRNFETLIPAFQWISTPLFIYGTGNFFEQAKQLVEEYRLQDKVFLKGPIEPEKLKEITPKAILGITIFENKGLSNYYSLANRFFDYMHAGIPQICVDYPAYKEINTQFKVAVLVNDLSSEALATAINNLLHNNDLQTELRENCEIAKKLFNWQAEEKKLVNFYDSVFSAVPFTNSVK